MKIITPGQMAGGHLWFISNFFAPTMKELVHGLPQLKPVMKGRAKRAQAYWESIANCGPKVQKSESGVLTLVESQSNSPTTSRHGNKL